MLNLWFSEVSYNMTEEICKKIPITTADASRLYCPKNGNDCESHAPKGVISANKSKKTAVCHLPSCAFMRKIVSTIAIGKW